MVFAMKEAGWKQERKKMKEEGKMLRRMVEECEERIKEMEDGGRGESSENSILIEKLEEERARRDEAVERWKQLYLDIKTELDHLILTAHDGNGICCRGEDVVEGLVMALQAKEETIEALKAEVESAERERHKRERDVDILRQSMRIMRSKEVSKVKKTQQDLSLSSLL